MALRDIREIPYGHQVGEDQNIDDSWGQPQPLALSSPRATAFSVTKNLGLVSECPHLYSASARERRVTL